MLMSLWMVKIQSKSHYDPFIIKEDKLSIMKRICMVAYTNYSIDPRVRRAAESLVGEGFTVDVFVLKEKSGVSYEKFNGVNLYYMNQKKYRGNSNIFYIISYIEFFYRVLIKLSLIFFRKKYSVIHCHNMPDFIVFTAIIPKLFGAKIILDIHDSMPDTYKAKDFNPIFLKIIYQLLLLQEKISANFVDLIITVHEPFKNVILKSHGIDLKKVHVIMNLADKNIFHYQTRPPKNKEGKLKLIYHGTIAPRFGLEVTVKGLKKIVENNYKIKFDIYGDGEGFSFLKSSIEKLNLQEVIQLHGSIPLNDIPLKIAEADLGIVSYLPSEATNFILPSKLMEYIAMEKPVLTVKNTTISHYFMDGELEYYEANNPESFAEKLHSIINNSKMLDDSKNKIKFINRRLNWNKEKVKYIKLIKKLSN